MAMHGKALAILLAIGLTACSATAPVNTGDSPSSRVQDVEPDLVKADGQTDTIAPPADWGPPLSTPGTRLIPEERGASRVEKKQAVSYGFATHGFPKQKIFTLWVRSLAGKTVRLATLRVDESGNLITAQGVPLAKQVFNFYGLFRGEPIDFALVATDDSVRAFARVVPFPLQARGDSGCLMALEMLSPGGKEFGVIGSGFKPNDDVSASLIIDDQTRQRKLKVSGRGSFADVIDLRHMAKSGGTATYLAAGKGCKVKIDYEWGDASKSM